jgi:hypothetical protein
LIRKWFLLLPALLLLNSALEGYYYGQNKVNATRTSWSQIQTMHFDVYFPAGQDNFGRLAALMAEDTYYYLKKDFRFPAVSRIAVIFYTSRQEFQTTNIIYPILSEGVGGFTETIRNRVVVPFDGSYKNLEQVLTHELTHAYINALDTGSPGSFFYLRNFNFPFWFSEGLPEFQAMGGSDVSNNAFMLDLVINDRLPELSNASGYSAYRMGESFLLFLRKRYGREKVMDYLYSLRALNDIDKASKRIFGMEFRDLEQRWRNQLKRDFYPFIQSHALPSEFSTAKTKHREDGSYFNLAPRFAPDGSKYIYYSNRDGRFSIWSGGLFEFSRNEKLITGEASGSIEEFHYLRSGLAWFPDSKCFAFATKTTLGDKLYIADYDSKKIITQIDFPGLKSIYELDISPDGTSCVFAAQSALHTDIYQYHFNSGELVQLTSDSYSEAQPRFSPDGSRIAFASERTKVADEFRQGYFSNLRSNIYTLDLQNKVLQQVTFNGFNCTYPVWDSTGTALVYISERDSVPNLESIDLVQGKRSVLTKVLSGIYAFDFNPGYNYLVYSCYFDGGWDIYLKTAPLADLNYIDSSIPEQVVFEDTLLNSVDLSRLGLYGQKLKHKPVTDGGPLYTAKHPTEFNFNPAADSIKITRDFSWDDRPDSTAFMPEIKPYRIKLRVDSFFGGFAYSSSVGTIGNLVMSLSDVMGDHGIGINLGIAGKIKDSNLILTYLYLPYRIDYGVGVFNLMDEVLYRNTITDDYYRERIREAGLYYLMRYPVSKFLRFDFEHQLYSREYHWDSWIWTTGDDGFWLNDAFVVNGTAYDYPAEKDLVYAPALTLVHDNTLYGSTGPLLGWRAYLTLRKSFALHSNDYHTVYADLRSYTLFSRRYSLALRLVGGFSGGKTPQTFDLNGYYGIRGYDEEVTGEKIALASVELRYPFLDYLQLAFPLPITIGSLRGSLFADLGGVWDSNADFQGVQDGRLRDLHLGFGFGPRLNIGIAVLKFDFAWNTDLFRVSKPTYYFSLTEDF